jgi:soluble lytic murein transglycosylase-like protein
LARALARTTLALRVAIDAWAASGGEHTWPPPSDVTLQALYQQRIYRALAQAPALAARVVARLPAGVAQEARTNIEAGRHLFSLAHRPTHGAPVALRTRPPLPAAVLLRYYQEAQRRFHVSWEVLAAVNYIESKFGRVVSSSSAGAQGPMQFIPSTWAAYGLGGDVHDPHDAILGAANYLHASGAPGDYARALYAYNHAMPYVSAVLLYARRMANDPRAFLEYYNWQVFVLTRTGDERLTGPGLS